ncbi:MAG: hypothetical protein HDT39_08675 [Lachnospiraceae bacterium]|nr:hypothetical protein [Lachnospiraceae bacterium]
MFDEMLEVFEAELEKKSEKWLYDNYIPVPGTYIMLNIDDNFSIRGEILFIEKPDKKTGDIIAKNNKNYEFIRLLDKNSKLITMNKPIDTGKIIHSNNFYSLFVKKESLKNGKYTSKNIDNYYNTLANPKEKYKNKNSRQMYESVEKKLGEVNTDILTKIKDWVQNHFLDFIAENRIDTESKDYIKIFFVYSDDEKTKSKIKIEGERYFLPNIFNSNDYNQTVNDETFGLHNNNMGLNNKKPFLANRTRKVSIPCAVSMDKALSLYLFMEYLSSQAAIKKYNIYFDLDNKKIISTQDNVEIEPIESGIYLRIRQSKTETAIYSMERICGYRPKLKKPLRIKEILKLSDKSKKDYYNYYGTKYKLHEIEQIVNEVLFNKYLISNYKSSVDEFPSKMDSTVKEYLTLCREQLWNWFHNNDDTNVLTILNKACKNLIYDTFINGFHEKTKNQFNLWFSLADYLDANEKRGENMSNAKELLIKHLSSDEEWEFENSDEYYYAVGQITYLLNNFSKASKKALDMVRPIITVKDNELLKKRITQLAKKYDYAFDMRYKKTRTLLAKILIYTTDAKVNDVIIMAGYIDDNLLYKSNKQKETITENE